MRLITVHLRFFRSFNYDYELKADPRSEVRPWELIDGSWFPFVRVHLEPGVTAVVGANESGKSHLIDAISFALTGDDVRRSDFCRYSSLYSVETGRVRLPDFGVTVELEDSDVLELSSLPVKVAAGDRVTLIRFGGAATVLVDTKGKARDLDGQALSALQTRLPRPFQLATNVPLPDSISLDAILGRETPALERRRDRFALVDMLRNLDDGGPDDIRGIADDISALIRRPQSDDQRSSESLATPTSLARELLLRVAKIDPSTFENLEEAVRDGNEGEVAALEGEINRSLARHLNFTRWWRQDPDFRLQIAAREREIVFTIQDRTGKKYSFQERSRGLTYFLSYYVQLLAHEPAADRGEVLLMDEPDAFLSSLGQQDLLRRLEYFASPDDLSRADQVVYVTHSPFLINKNAAQRIRVLDKGTNEEGTRVVRDAAQNRYEPLRSSIGAYVAETAFIGGSNLFVEGLSDQVLLTGMTAVLRHRGVPPRQLLELNDVTIVAAGSAGHLPYMVYLARSRDEVKPACAVLIDGDQAGREAKRKLRRSDDGSRRPIINDSYVVDLAEWAIKHELTVEPDVVTTEIEDLIPFSVAVEALRSYAIHLLEATSEEAAQLNKKTLSDALERERRPWKAIEAAFASVFQGANVDKVGFAKELVAYVHSILEERARPTGVRALEQNFAKLIAELADRLRQAELDESDRRSGNRTDRLVDAFLRDHVEATNRDEASQLMRDLLAGLGDSAGDETVRREIADIERDFRLGSDALALVGSYEEFRRRLEQLRVKRRLAYRTADLPANAGQAPATD